MGNSPNKEGDGEEVSHKSSRGGARLRSRQASQQSSGLLLRSTSKNLGRSRAGTRLSIRVSQIAAQLGKRRPKSVTLRAQMFRERQVGFKGRTVPVGADYGGQMTSENPRFVKKRLVEKSKSAVQAVRSGTLVSIERPNENLEERPKSMVERGSFDVNSEQVFSPKPPKTKKLRARYAVTAHLKEIPFEKNDDHLDYKSYKFSALSLSEEELKNAAVEMLLCTINSEVVKAEQLNLNVLRSKMTLNSRYNNRKTFGSMFSRSGKSSLKSTGSNETKINYLGSKYPLQPLNCITEEVREAVVEFVDLVASQYTETRYHSFKHAVDVTQMMFMLGYFLRSSLRAIDPFVLIVACLCHDIGHFGANNIFLSKLDPGQFREKFSGCSSLEQFHVFVFKKAVQESRLFSTEFMRNRTKEFVERTVEDLILSTDMDRHDEVLKAAESNLKAELAEVKEGKEGRQFLPMEWLSLSIKICDVANVAREFEDAKQWCILLSQEFEAMGRILFPQNEKLASEILTKNCENLQNEEYSASLERNEIFKINENLTSKCLVAFQEHCLEPDFADSATLTSGFIVSTALPMAVLMSEVQPQAAWFLMDRMHQNLQSWMVAIKQADGEETSD